MNYITTEKNPTKEEIQKLSRRIDLFGFYHYCIIKGGVAIGTKTELIKNGYPSQHLKEITLGV